MRGGYSAAIGLALISAAALQSGGALAQPGCSDPIMHPCQPKIDLLHKRKGRGNLSFMTRLHNLMAGSAGRAAGVVRSRSGATARVAPRAAAAFQCLIDGLDRQGYPIRFMGGYRAHGSVRGSLHPRGLALDINQIGRNRTVPRMPANEIALARKCHLVSGRQWANGDSGHFQVGGWPGRRYAGAE